jgi:nitroreductase
MKNIRIPILVVALFAGGAILHSQDKGNCFTDLIHSSYSSKLFNKVPVTDRQIELVLQSGVRAPSARNSQTWRFTVVKDNMLAQGIIRDALPGYVLIVVSGPETDQPGMNTDIDCSPATAYIYLAAQSLGLASHLYTPDRLGRSMRNTGSNWD